MEQPIQEITHHSISRRALTLAAGFACMTSAYIGVHSSLDMSYKAEVAVAGAGGTIDQSNDLNDPNNDTMPTNDQLLGTSSCDQDATLEESVRLAKVMGLSSLGNDEASKLKKHDCDQKKDMLSYLNNPERAETINRTMLQLANKLRLFPASIKDQEFQKTDENEKIVNADFGPDKQYHVDALITALNEAALNHEEGYYDTYITQVALTVTTPEKTLSMTLLYKNGQVVLLPQGFYNPPDIIPTYTETQSEKPTTSSSIPGCNKSPLNEQMSVSKDAVMFAGGGALCDYPSPQAPQPITKEQNPKGATPVNSEQDQLGQMMPNAITNSVTAYQLANKEYEILKGAEAALELLAGK